MTPRCMILVAAACGAACTPAEAPDEIVSAVTNGTPDLDDPAVVAVLAPDGTAACSGSLIGPHTVLTAAHCIPPQGRRLLQVFFGDSLAGGGVSIAVSDARAHPAFDAATLENDVAMFTLREAGPAAPLSLDPRVIDASLVGATFRVVGFGRTAPDADDEGERRTGTARVTAVDSVDVTAAPDPSLPCRIDSGGPALRDDGGEERIFGVVSHGDAACEEETVFARVDVASDAFIAPYLADTAPGTAATGDACFYEEHCADGPCRQAADDPLLYFCTRACDSDGDCPAEMCCRSGECSHRLPSPGALGSACAGADACTSDVCYLPDGVDQGTCTQSCLGAPDSCPPDFDCVAVSTFVNYCLPPSGSGGCTAAPGRSGEAAWAVLVALFALGVGRRRQRRP